MFRHADVVLCVLCAPCNRSQCCVLRDLQFVIMLVEDARGDHTEVAYSRAGRITAL